MIDQTREAEVWSRVMAASAEAPMPVYTPAIQAQSEQTEIQRMIEQERLDSCTYAALARRTKGEIRRELLQLQEQARCQARRLETVYYLMTGMRLCSDWPKGPCITCTNETLRQQYQAETVWAERYRRTADRTEGFAQELQCLARFRERRAQRILRLLQRSL